MNDDIVTRLRNYDFMRDGDFPELTMAEAADEIERLRELAEQLSIELSRHEYQSLPCKGTVDCECGISKAQHIWGFGQAVRGE